MRFRIFDGEQLRGYTVLSSESVNAAMGQMNETGHTLLAVLDSADPSTLVGVLADGDVRRFLVAGGSRDAPVADAANTSPVVLDDAVDNEQIRRHLGRVGVTTIPLVSDHKLTGLAVVDPELPVSSMSVVVMAGGLGSRLAPLTDSCPKPLLPLAGKPILTHVIDELRSQGFRQLIVSLNYLGSLIVDHYQDGSHWDVEIEYIHETRRLGTGGALGLVNHELLTDPFVVMNGDLLHDIDLAAVEELHRLRSWDATMVVRPQTYTLDYGVVDVAEDGSFQRIREKPTEERLINAGVYVLSKSTLELVPGDQHFDLPSLFEQLAASERPCGSYRHTGRWIDIGTKTEYERAERIFADEERGHE